MTLAIFQDATKNFVTKQLGITDDVFVSYLIYGFIVFAAGIGIYLLISFVRSKMKRQLQKDRRRKKMIEGSARQTNQPIAGHNGIRHYPTMEDLPAYSSILSRANSEICILTVTAEYIATQQMDSIRNALLLGRKVTILILDPKSPFVAKKESALGEARHLAQRIRTNLDLFCAVKESLDKENNKLAIMTYDADTNATLTIIDPNSENAWILVTSYLYGKSPISRPSADTYKRENMDFFNQNFNYYNQILSRARVYSCQ